MFSARIAIRLPASFMLPPCRDFFDVLRKNASHERAQVPTPQCGQAACPSSRSPMAPPRPEYTSLVAVKVARRSGLIGPSRPCETAVCTDGLHEAGHGLFRVTERC